MAARYWVGTDTSWNTSANWSTTSGGSGGAGVPTSSDDVTFDGNGTNNCTCDVAISCLSLTFASGYTGTFDYADSSYAHSIAGDLTFSHAGAIDYGNATITVSGNFDYNSFSGSITIATGTVKMNGSSKYVSGPGVYKDNRLEIDGTIEISSSSSRVYTSGLVVNSGKSLDILSNFWVQLSDFTNNGTIYSNNTWFLDRCDVTSWGTITGAYTVTATVSNNSSSFSGGSINAPFVIKPYNNTACTFGLTGSLSFYEDVSLITDAVGESLTFAPNNYNLVFQNDLIQSHTGTFAWSNGTGTITLSGTNNQDIDFNGESTEEINVNKTSGTATLAGDVDPDYLYINSGTLDIDGNNVTTSGTFFMDAGTTCNDTTGGGLITCANFNIDGTAGSPCVFNGPDVDVTVGTTASADNCTVTNSDASAGETITATNCTDGGGNTNWNFGDTASQQRGSIINFTEEIMGALLQI